MPLGQLGAIVFGVVSEAVAAVHLLLHAVVKRQSRNIFCQCRFVAVARLRSAADVRWVYMLLSTSPLALMGKLTEFIFSHTIREW